jgi:hypothetical protein
VIGSYPTDERARWLSLVGWTWGCPHSTHIRHCTSSILSSCDASACRCDGSSAASSPKASVSGSCLCAHREIGLPFVLPIRFFFGGGFRPWQAGEARSPEGTRKISWDQRSELSNAMIVPQGDVVANMARSEDKLILILGNAVGTAFPATPIDIPVCYRSTRKTGG